MIEAEAKVVVSADVGKATAQFGALKKSVSDFGTTAAQSTKTARVSFASLQSGVASAGIAVAGVTAVAVAAKRAFDQVVVSTINYNKSILDSANAIGTTTEQLSRIVQVTDDFGISQEATTRALQLMTKNGLAPNIDSLADLSDRLNAISDPTERAAEAAHLLGRSWAVLDPLLQTGGKNIRAMAAAVSDSLVVTKAEAEASERLRLQIDMMNDAWVGAKTTLNLFRQLIFH